MRKLFLPLLVLALLATLPWATDPSRAASTTNLVITEGLGTVASTPPGPFDAKNVTSVPSDAAPGYATGSMASNGVGKTDLYLTPAALFGRDITLGEVESISYWTKTGATHSVDPRDWYVNIYTKPYPGDISSATWYGDRIGSEPYFSANIADPANTWNRWTTDGPANKLRFFESTAGAPGATFGAYTDPDWDTFKAANALSGLPRATRAVLFFSMQTGSAWAAGFTGKIDGLRIELADGSVANVNFEPFTPCGAVCYVDAATGDDAYGGDTPATAKKTIQGGVNQVNPGGTVHVAAGTYHEDVLVNKSLSLLGAGHASTTVSGVIGGGTSTIHVSAPAVVIDGFTVTRDGNNPTQWNLALNLAGVSVQSQGNYAEVRNNRFVGNRTGIDINHSNGNNIHNNIIDDNRTGMIFRNQTDNTTVTENYITNNWTVGVLFLDASSGTNVPVQSALNSNFTNNNISGNWYGQVVDRQAGGALPTPGTNTKTFEFNWWGTTSPVVSTANSAEPGYAAQIPVAYGGTATPPGGQPDIAGPASANIDYVPMLCSGTDTNIETALGRGTIGFQGDPAQNTFYQDNDNDGYGNPNVTVQGCTPPPGYVADNTDCNDNVAAINPGATEVCDGIDNDCDGVTDEGFTNTDGDLLADCVDPDDDNDGVADGVDNCPLTAGSAPSGCPVPGSRDACKKDGWKALTRANGSPFNNQGDCIQYFNTGK